jgi:hypothetical protein
MSFSCKLNLGGVNLNLVKVIGLIALAYFKLLYLVVSYRFLSLGLKV